MKTALAAVVAAIATAAAAVAISNDEGGPKNARPSAPSARVASTGGGFRPPATPEGMPLFTARNLLPGDITRGDVRVVNRGGKRGFFYLTQAELTDLPGPEGGALSPVLRMTVLDVTVPGRPKTVYSGGFAEMDARPLGFFRPAQSRSYRFSAQLPERGTKPELFVGSAVSARYVWSPLGDAPRRDRRPPRLELAVAPVQGILELGYLEATVRCGEPCRLTIRGSVQVGRERRRQAPVIGRREAGPREPAVLRVRLPERSLRRLPRVLLSGGVARIRVTLRGRDLAGNLASVRRTIRLRRKR